MNIREMTNHKTTTEILARRIIGTAIRLIFNDCIVLVELKEWSRNGFDAIPITVERK